MNNKKGVLARTGASLLLCISMCALGQAPATSTSAETRTANHLESVRQQPLLLQAFLREMPKGGDLHNHLGASTYAEDLVEYAARDNLCLEQSTRTLVPGPESRQASRRQNADFAIRNCTIQ